MITRTTGPSTRASASLEPIPKQPLNTHRFGRGLPSLEAAILARRTGSRALDCDFLSAARCFESFTTAIFRNLNQMLVEMAASPARA